MSIPSSSSCSSTDNGTTVASCFQESNLTLDEDITTSKTQKQENLCKNDESKNLLNWCHAHSGSHYFWTYTISQIMYGLDHTPDTLIKFNQHGVSLILPSPSGISENFNPATAFIQGCQFVAMSFQRFDSNMEYYSLVFDKYKSSIVPKDCFLIENLTHVNTLDHSSIDPAMLAPTTVLRPVTNTNTGQIMLKEIAMIPNSDTYTQPSWTSDASMCAFGDNIPTPGKVNVSNNGTITTYRGY